MWNFVIKILFIGDGNSRNFIRRCINSQYTIGMTWQSKYNVSNNNSTKPFEFAIQYHVVGIKDWSDGMHCIGDSVYAQNACGVTRNAVYFLIGSFFATEVEGCAAKCSSVGSKSTTLLPVFIAAILVVDVVVDTITIRGVEIIQIRSTLRPMGDTTWWQR